MERNRRLAAQGSAAGPRAGSRPGSWDAAVASRLAALESLAATLLDDRSGPVLLTGEAGAGKTWVRRRLVEGLPEGWRPAIVEAAPAIDPVDFLTLAAARLGVSPLPERPSTLRLAIEKALEDDVAEGRSWLLVVEDAHHASPAVWAEVEALCDRLGEPGGFAAVLMTGRTELVRRMSAPPLRDVAARLSGHVHLPPVDVEEAARMLALPEDEAERLHRDAAGNPRRLLTLAGRRVADRLPAPAAPRAEAPPPMPSFAPPAKAPAAPVIPHPGIPKVEFPVEPRPIPPALLPSRPPLRVEEGLIEVGWDDSLEAEDIEEAEDAEAASGPVDGEMIEDHYAALQAWSEWARNRDRLAEPADAAAESPGPSGEAEVEPDAPAPPPSAPAEDEDESGLSGDLRAEPPHDHAPYSQLFGKLRQSS